ncbi:MAG: hypothetical protein DCC49_13870 [Acidobacteria bacterium]|nr:MAG: hypothetical protein DCC49_13870 [Acidobacteriota bacterium]
MSNELPVSSSPAVAPIRCVVSVFAVLLGGLAGFVALCVLLDSYGLSQRRGVPFEIALNTVFLAASFASASLFATMAFVAARASRHLLSTLTVLSSLALAVTACYVTRVAWGLYNPLRGTRWSLDWVFVLTAATGYVASAAMTSWLAFFGRGRNGPQRTAPGPHKN